MNDSIAIPEYRSRTLRVDNLERLSFLPCFPSSIVEQTKIDQQQETSSLLLLSNVPGMKLTILSASQLQRRQLGAFKQQFKYIEHKHIHAPSFMKFIYKNFIFDLSRKLKVDESIIDFNLARLAEITIQSVLYRINQHDQDDIHYNLNQAYHMHEWPIALEIFLQIDVDTFYMKTCSFRGSHPRLLDENINDSTEGLFCIDSPDTRYLMLPCTNSSCPCCYQSLDVTRRTTLSVQFASEQSHRFVNGYQVYLNCHATCKTTHFLYALTCPCGQFDFIGSSHDPNESFKDVLLYHRRQSIRILHEFLLGEKIIKRTLDMYEKQKTIEEKKADQKRLYRHLTECSTALQLLLNCAPHYWCFIPMQMEDAEQEDMIFNNILTNPQDNRKTSNFDHSQDWSPCERTDQEVAWCLANLPKTPDGTRFSCLQLNKQKRFFKNGSDLLFLPPRHLDIFHMTIVFVLPENCSQLLCQTIESLLITHAECKLNTNGHLITTLEIEGLSHTHHSWYKNLVGRNYKS